MVRRRAKRRPKIRKYRVIFNKFFNFKKDLLTFPNLLTLIRIIFVPVVILLIWLDTPILRLWALIVYVIAGITDIFDGYIARKYESVSVTGKLLDPLADKFIVNLTLVLLVAMNAVSVWPVLIILGREFYIFGIRSIALEHGLVVEAGIFGKIKTWLQLLALPFFMFNQATLKALTNVDWNPINVGYILIWGSVIFSLLSAYTYSKKVKKRVFSR